jgi:tRNA pseudouridine13 synthase
MCVKVKRLPEDFIVEELTDVQPAEAGEFTLYRLQKRSVGTLEAVETIQQSWKLPRERMSWGGLKDRHAVTSQHLTIHRGPRRGLDRPGVTLECLGRVAAPFTAASIVGNRFHVVLRALGPDDLSRAEAALPQLARDGVPNYFDDQRFGSVSAGGEFIAEAWMRGDYERALWLTFAEPNPFDRGAEQSEKALLRSLWGRWAECKGRLGRSHRRSIVTFLADRPGDFKGAWARVNQDLRSLYLAAIQSQLWNELLALAVRESCPPDDLVEVPLKTGPLPFPVRLEETAAARLHGLALPLPSARIRLEEIADEWVRDLMQRALAARGWELRQVRVKHPRDSFFSKGVRAAMLEPRGLQWSSAPDELHPEQSRLNLSFDLPRGTYATILIKRITDAAGIAPTGRRARGGGP